LICRNIKYCKLEIICVDKFWKMTVAFG